MCSILLNKLNDHITLFVNYSFLVSIIGIKRLLGYIHKS